MSGVLIIFIVFSFVAFIVKMGLDHENQKRKLDQGRQGDNSMRMSELKMVIREAIEEANAPISDRLSALENRLEWIDTTNLLPPSAQSKRDYLDEPSE